jgi:cysteinyl-tRNA synthetase
VLQLFDTAKGAVAPVQLRDPGRVSMYVCGPTVYGPPHLGHGRFSLVFDVLRRYLEWSGLEVTYASNITDVDDNIITKATAEGRTAQSVVDEYEAVWYEAMDAIGVKRPTHDPHATAYIEQMVELVADLVGRGAAYETADGVYFSVSSVDDYGLLARQELDTLRSGARVAVDDEKRSPLDFALWKKATGDGPGAMDAGPEPWWDSPWGPGRPGWHTECVAMSLDLLGDRFDIHGGGQDLAFPHHENERAQAVAGEHRFAAHWVHNGFVEVGGEKMSKSLGNFTTLVDLVERADPRAYRLLVLRAHYRSPVEVTEAVVADAEAALDRLDTFARRVAALPAAPPDAESVVQLRARMDDDLDTPGVVDLLFRLVRRANTALDEGRPDDAAPLVAAVQQICAAVGLELSAEAAEVPDEILALAALRDQARTDGNWAEADRLRAEMEAAGWIVEDGPDGTQVRPA